MDSLNFELSQVCLDSVVKLRRRILTTAALQLYREGRLTSRRAAKLAELSHPEFLRQIGEGPENKKMSEPPDPAQSLCGSRYLARVLWALSEGEKVGLTPMTASDIAKFISSHSDVQVQETNTARFFRDCRRSGKFEEYWMALQDGPRRHYRLSDQGHALWAEGLS